MLGKNMRLFMGLVNMIVHCCCCFCFEFVWRCLGDGEGSMRFEITILCFTLRKNALNKYNNKLL